MRLFKIDSESFSELAAELLRELTETDSVLSRREAFEKAERRRQGKGVFYDTEALYPQAFEEETRGEARSVAVWDAQGESSAPDGGAYELFPEERRRRRLSQRLGRAERRFAATGNYALKAGEVSGFEETERGGRDVGRLPEILSDRYCRDARRYDSAFRRY